LVNGFPDYNLQHLRQPGILQRISICYCCSGLFYLYINDYGKSVTVRLNLKKNLLKLGCTALSLLLLYWALLMLVPVPGIGTGLLDSYGNLPAYIDRNILTINHMWAYGLSPGKGVTLDPEGILSTLPAIASTFIGVLIGEWWIKSADVPIKKISLVSLVGAILIILALLFNRYYRSIKESGQVVSPSLTAVWLCYYLP
jgi:predicted acyltransferase